MKVDWYPWGKKYWKRAGELGGWETLGRGFEKGWQDVGGDQDRNCKPGVMERTSGNP